MGEFTEDSVLAAAEPLACSRSSADGSSDSVSLPEAEGKEEGEEAEGGEADGRGGSAAARGQQLGA